MSVAGGGPQASGTLTRMWCDTVTAAAKGKTQDTFDTFGTVTIKQKPDGGSYRIIGVVGLLVMAAVTSGENGSPVWRIESNDLGITSQDVVGVSNVMGDGIGTNDKEFPVRAFFDPLSIDPNKSTNNAKIDFTLSGAVTTTGGWSGGLGIIYGDGIPDANLRMELASLTSRPWIKAADTHDRGGNKASAFGAFSTGLSVPADAKELIALLGLSNPNAPTTVEASASVFKFESSQISDFQPQIWPSCIGHNSSVGTPVGTAPVGNGFYWPTRFPLPGNNITIDVSVKFAAALTNAPDNSAAYKARA